MNIIPITPIIYPAGSGGIPATTTAPLDMSLPQRMDSYEHTISATFGFESATISFTCKPDEAVTWMQQLGAAMEAYGPDAETIWEGYLTQVDATFGQEKRSISLDKMINRVKCRWTTVLATSRVTSAVTSATSIALYGTKDGVVSLSETNSTAATNIATATLAAQKFPVAAPSTEVASGDLGNVQVQLHFAGWYDRLAWLLTSITTKSTAVTTAQVQTLLTAYNSTNAFLSTVYNQITASGISDTQFVAPDTTYRAAIESLLKQGNSAGQRLAWGVYEGRKFVVNQWAGADPTTITYRRMLGDGSVYTAAGGRVEPWDVRPDAMYEVIDMLDPQTSTAADSAARFYIERVSFRANGNSIGVTLEPAASDALDARIARMK